MSDLPPPLVPPGTDVRNLDGFMLNVERLIASELLALSTGEEFKAAVCLWCRAWKQLPGGSLPDDDRVLAAFSGAGANWPNVREMAMRGFVKCSDGRWYQTTLCEDVLRAAQKKKERDERTKAATEARKRQRHDQRDDQRDVVRDVPPDNNVTTSHRRDETGQDRDRTGTGQGHNNAALPANVVSDDQVDHLCRIAGVRPEITDNRLINSWLSAGLSLQQIERALKLKRDRMDEPPKTLRFYDGAVKDALKPAKSQTAAKPPRPPKPDMASRQAAVMQLDIPDA